MFSELSLWNDGDLHSVYLGTRTSSITFYSGDFCPQGLWLDRFLRGVE